MSTFKKPPLFPFYLKTSILAVCFIRKMEDNVREACVKMVETFVVGLFSGKCLEALMRGWSRISLSGSAIESNEKLFDSIINSKIELSITHNHVEIFKDVPYLRIPLELLSSDSYTLLKVFTSNKYWGLFFGATNIEGDLGQHIKFIKFKFDGIVSHNINRHSLVAKVIREILTESIDEQNLSLFLDVVQILTASVNNLMIKKENRVEDMYKLQNLITGADFYEDVIKKGIEWKEEKRIAQLKEDVQERLLLLSTEGLE
jgi:hypothetical protein